MRPQALEQPLLARVADRITCRVTTRRGPAHGRAPCPHIPDRDVIDGASLESEEPRTRGVRRRSNGAKTQSGTDPGGARIPAEQLERFGRSAPAAIRRPLSRAHTTILTLGASLLLIGSRRRSFAEAGPARGPSDNWQVGRERFRRATTGAWSGSRTTDRRRAESGPLTVGSTELRSSLGPRRGPRARGEASPRPGDSARGGEVPAREDRQGVRDRPRGDRAKERQPGDVDRSRQDVAGGEVVEERVRLEALRVGPERAEDVEEVR